MQSIDILESYVELYEQQFYYTSFPITDATSYTSDICPTAASSALPPPSSPCRLKRRRPRPQQQRRRHSCRAAAINAAVLGLSSSLDSLYTGDVTLAFTSVFFSTQVLRCSFLTSFIMLLCVVFVCSCAAPPLGQALVALECILRM